MTDAVLPDCLYIEGFKQAHASSKASMHPGDKVKVIFAADGVVADGQYGRLRVPWSAIQGLDCRGPVEPEGEPRDLSFAVLLKASGLVRALDRHSQPHRWCYLAVRRSDGPELIFLVRGYVVAELEHWLDEHSAGAGP